MRTYTAHLKSDAFPVLMRDGWSWLGFLFGPIWLFATRSWVPALLEIAGLGLLFGLAPAGFWPPALLALMLINGLLGRDLVGWSLERRGYRLGHVVIATDREAALLRLLAARPDLMDTAR